MKKINKMPKLQGEIPLLYKRETIFNMCIAINALIDRVNYLVKTVEQLEKRSDTK